MTSWAWKPNSRTRAAIRRGDSQYRQWQQRISEQIATELRARRGANKKVPAELADAVKGAAIEHAADVVGVGRTIVGQAKDAT